MKQLLMGFFLLLSIAGQAGTLSVNFSLRPVGYFLGTTAALQGHVQREGESYVGFDIKVPVSELKTGNALRDRKLKERLENESVAFLDRPTGRDGVFEGILNFRGQSHKLKGTYRVEGFQFIAQFELSLTELGLGALEYHGVKVLDSLKIQAALPILSRVPSSAL